ncbi:MAG: hypothetical protein KF757_10500 [Phycisphaeraceae bacterium]|nr:hypothetical protein [Phycisphaeraceae bacterium]MCW5764089.1 hypothetical protein [Phycisphaeraceae bacterium]
MSEFVLLCHTLPDGTWHHDWLIEQLDPAEMARPLLSFRTAGRPDLGEDFEAERAPDHRIEYLRFEGELSGGRGTVRQIAGGRAEIRSMTGDMLAVDLFVGGRRFCFAGRVFEGNRWKFACAIHNPGG